ncbi:MAG TPA: PD-(D/E)XK nuclease superfamily protein, partial [Chloroflexota bacterium]|nr:PD-(D/E)XK nuclease superfamily protein [Chloroflexota bacterium]
MPRNSATGAVLEAMILPSLIHGGYTYTKQYLMGTRPGGRRHFLDVLARDTANDAYAISLKWQQSSGTAEAKVPYEMMSMVELRQNHPGVIRAYIILAGDELFHLQA